MEGQRRSIAVEQRIPSFIKTENGCEVITNDGELKITLSYSRMHLGSIESLGYTATYFVKEDNGWQKTSEARAFTTLHGFMNEISKAEELSQAYSDYEEYVNNKRAIKKTTV